MSEYSAENGLPACGSCGEPAPYIGSPRRVIVQDEPRMFRAACSCGGYVGPWKNTNAAMGWGRRHVAAMRRKAPVSGGGES